MRAPDSRPGEAPALAPGEKSLLVPATARRSTDARGNSLIRLPDSRQIRLLKNGQVEILNRAGQVTERGFPDSRRIQEGKGVIGAYAYNIDKRLSIFQFYAQRKDDFAQPTVGASKRDAKLAKKSKAFGLKA